METQIIAEIDDDHIAYHTHTQYNILCARNMKTVCPRSPRGVTDDEISTSKIQFRTQVIRYTNNINTLYYINSIPLVNLLLL